MAATFWTLLGSDPAAAQAALPIAVPAVPLPQAIDVLSRQAGISIGTEGALPQQRVGPLNGHMPPDEALRRLLAGTGLHAVRIGPKTFRIAHVQGQEFARPRGDTAPTPIPPFVDDRPIIVTARKQSQALDTLPFAVSVVRLPESSGGASSGATAEVASSVDGLALTGLGSGRNRIFLRGVADSSFTGMSQTTVAVVIDDSRVTYSAPDPDLRLVDVDRVEIVKGPQGSLYGSGTLGGIYHIVTRPPDLTEIHGMASAGISAVGDGDVGYSASAMANLPLSRDQLGLRLVAYRERDPGWIDTGNHKDSNALDVVGGRANLVWRDPNSGWSAAATGMFQNQNSQDSQYVYAPDTLRRPAQLAEPHDNDFTHGAMRLEGPLGAVHVQIITGLTWQEVNDTFDATIGAGSLGLANPQAFTDNRQYRVWDNELRLSGSRGEIRWLVGLSHLEAKLHSVRALTSASPALTPLLIENGERFASETALFGEATLPIVKNVSATVGGRLFLGHAQDRLDTIAGTTSRAEKNVGGTPDLTLSWHPRQGRLFFLRYGSAVRNGGLEVSPDRGRSTFEGDELATLEVGMRQDLPGGKLELSGYRTWWDNVQSDALLPSGLIETRNAGQARILGFEASLDQALGKHTHFTLGAIVQSALLTRNALGIPLDDRRLPATPGFTLRAGIERRFPVGRAHASIAARIKYLGSTRLSFDPALDRKMGDSLETQVTANLDYGGWGFSLEFQNLANSRSNPFAYGNPFRLRDFPEFTPQEPFNVKATVGKRF